MERRTLGALDTIIGHPVHVVAVHAGTADAAASRVEIARLRPGNGSESPARLRPIGKGRSDGCQRSYEISR